MKYDYITTSQIQFVVLLTIQVYLAARTIFIDLSFVSSNFATQQVSFFIGQSMAMQNVVFSCLPVNRNEFHLPHHIIILACCYFWFDTRYAPAGIDIHTPNVFVTKKILPFLQRCFLTFHH